MCPEVYYSHLTSWPEVFYSTHTTWLWHILQYLIWKVAILPNHVLLVIHLFRDTVDDRLLRTHDVRQGRTLSITEHHMHICSQLGYVYITNLNWFKLFFFCFAWWCWCFFKVCVETGIQAFQVSHAVMDRWWIICHAPSQNVKHTVIILWVVSQDIFFYWSVLCTFAEQDKFFFWIEQLGL